jgi:lipopolysaccharide transport system ATP-binding protein
MWALQDVSLEVNRGEVVGIIGRNGAGKSTLLKILSRITEPTAGEVDIHGRVGSLLEVGTGFHPELTGRENIYLNGAILGMKRREIDTQLDAIVAFAEVEQFLDTPVKHYSSGMYMRLAFAVAAHLDTEILLLDEVLAVGDTAFQKKCLGRMGEIAREGRSVLFVSHNLGAIRSLCQTACLLSGGQVVARDTPEACVREYLAQGSGDQAAGTVVFPSGLARLRMTSATVLCNDCPSPLLHFGDSLTIEVTFASDAPLTDPKVGLVLTNSSGDRVLNTNNRYLPSPTFETPVRTGTIRSHLGQVPLMADTYFVSLYFGDGNDDAHVVEHAITFEVHEANVWGTRHLPQRRCSMLWWPTRFSLGGAEGAGNG